MRSIPATMATQHPDNATAPYWDEAGRPFISVHQEIVEAVKCFQDLDVDEYMWDWEGKHADAAVIDRLFSDYHEYFSKTQLGRDKFLTFRIPNIWEEKGYNLLQAMSVILSSEDFARDLKFKNRPLFEVILPMTERSDQIMHMHKLFKRLAKFKSSEFTADEMPNTEHLELIPLVESVESQINVGNLLNEYISTYQAEYGNKPEYIRAFLACSDSALSSGFLAGLLGNKVALARLYEFSQASGIPVYPIMGCGSLRFRGGLSPATVDRFLEEFPGVRTVTLQSAFRYDYPLKDVKTAINKLESKLPKLRPLKISQQDQAELIAITEDAAKYYKQTLSQIASDMQPIFKMIPKRRDRRQHIGLLAYSRKMGGQSMPRAITFTAGFYSVGIPPEFIGLGRTLKGLDAANTKLLKMHYPNLINDIEAAGRFLNKENLNKFAAGNPGWQAVKTDVEQIEEVLNISLGPDTADQKSHLSLSKELTNTDDSKLGTELITKMAIIRKSLG